MYQITFNDPVYLGKQSHYTLFLPLIILILIYQRAAQRNGKYRIKTLPSLFSLPPGHLRSIRLIRNPTVTKIHHPTPFCLRMLPLHGRLYCLCWHPNGVRGSDYAGGTSDGQPLILAS